ncbi:MAG: hypothetical protein U0457_20215 [Candidatus Sericytochromatia bacterium]
MEKLSIANNKECFIREETIFFIYTTNLELSNCKILHFYIKKDGK